MSSEEKPPKRAVHKVTFYVRDPNLLERLRRILDREGKSLSGWLHEQARDYVRRHEPGNPQLTLASFGPEVLDPALLFKLCKHARWGEDLHGPSKVPWCYVRPHHPRFPGMHFELCEGCSSWKRRS